MSKKKVTMRTDTVEVSKFVSPDNICQLIGCSRATAYRIIQKLNKELEAQGNIVVRGRVSYRYFMERYYM